MPDIKTLTQSLRRDNFLDALRQYIDARIHYAEGDPEWRNEPVAEANALDDALRALLGHEEDGHDG